MRGAALGYLSGACVLFLVVGLMLIGFLLSVETTDNALLIQIMPKIQMLIFCYILDMPIGVKLTYLFFVVVLWLFFTPLALFGEQVCFTSQMSKVSLNLLLDFI